VAEFMVGVFGVTFAGGLVLTIGPGRLLLGLVPRPRGTVRHVIELVAGVVLPSLAVAVWMGRRERGFGAPATGDQSSRGGG
jgi:hypothetical protein